jgi:hypothetical protein
MMPNLANYTYNNAFIPESCINSDEYFRPETVYEQEGLGKKC